MSPPDVSVGRKKRKHTLIVHEGGAPGGCDEEDPNEFAKRIRNEQLAELKAAAGIDQGASRLLMTSISSI